MAPWFARWEQVALFPSAWIETTPTAAPLTAERVALFPSAWIETDQELGLFIVLMGRALPERVD